LAHYPTELAPNITFLEAGTGLGERADSALESLQEKGFVASVGLTALHLPRIYEMAQEAGIVENCPSDQLTRFHPDCAARWVGKSSGGLEPGRGFTSIHDVIGNDGAPLNSSDIANLTDADVRPVVYGWSGWEKNKHLIGKDITTAYRVSELGSQLARDRRSDGESFGLGSPITELVLATGVVLYGAPADRISLEAWKSNHRARSLYERIGFVRVPEADVLESKGRPTLHQPGEDIDGNVVFQQEGKNLVVDTRMNYYLADHPLLESK
jgi:hypothetical protein